MSTLFITFGCSWTAGVGSAYYDGMPIGLYEEMTKIGPSVEDTRLHDANAYRTVLSTKYDLVNLNFSQGGSSNQRQWRLAKEYFGSTAYKNDKENYSNIIVLHAITSTARNEFYVKSFGGIVNKLFSNCKFEEELFPSFIEFSYDHNHEVKQLVTEMLFWNQFYESQNIKHVWVDTLNHHSYNTSVPNLLNDDGAQRDLLSMLCFRNGMKTPDSKYHKSTWQVDTNRVPYLVEKKILNPHSYHPTKEGHIQIADYLSPSIEALLT